MPDDARLAARVGVTARGPPCYVSHFRLAMEGVIGGEDGWRQANEKERSGRFLPKSDRSLAAAV